MKKIMNLILGLLLALLQINPVFAVENINPLGFYDSFYSSNTKRVELNGYDVTSTFMEQTNTYFKNKDYKSIREIEKEGYVLSYEEETAQTRAFEQKVKKYIYKGLNCCQDSKFSNVTCDWMVSFLCKYSVNANTGKIASVSEPTLTLEYGVISLFTGSVKLSNQSAYIAEKGSNYVKFGYKFTVVARAQTGIVYETLTFTTRSGTEKL